MSLGKFIGQGILFFTRAGAHAFETRTIRIAFSAILIALAQPAFALQKENLFQKLSTETDAVKRVSLLAQLTAAHITNDDVTKLEPFLQDTDARVRLQTIAILGSTKHKTVAAALSDVLTEDTDAGVRAQAAFWLGSMKSSTSIDALERALREDSDANVRTQAAQALRKIGTLQAKASLRHGKTDKDSRVKKLANE